MQYGIDKDSFPDAVCVAGVGGGVRDVVVVLPRVLVPEVAAEEVAAGALYPEVNILGTPSFGNVHSQFR